MLGSELIVIILGFFRSGANVPNGGEAHIWMPQVSRFCAGYRKPSRHLRSRDAGGRDIHRRM